MTGVMHGESDILRAIAVSPGRKTLAVGALDSIQGVHASMDPDDYNWGCSSSTPGRTSRSASRCR